ncbi:hypothetical protein [Streptomyces sp. NPDC002671]
MRAGGLSEEPGVPQVASKAGTNTIRLTSAKDDGPNIGYLTVTAPDTSTRG